MGQFWHVPKTRYLFFQIMSIFWGLLYGESLENTSFSKNPLFQNMPFFTKMHYYMTFYHKFLLSLRIPRTRLTSFLTLLPQKLPLFWHKTALSQISFIIGSEQVTFCPKIEVFFAHFCTFYPKFNIIRIFTWFSLRILQSTGVPIMGLILTIFDHFWPFLGPNFHVIVFL